ncbi:MAG: penicillin-binding protein 2, partial [Nitrospirae bacterium]|nr:penicillin-binding protein 2 [Nitrospirota bacterium]
GDKHTKIKGDTPKELQDHAWFIAYAPAEDPKIAVAVLVEHGGHGGSVAAPIAKRIIERYLKVDEGKDNRGL